MRILVLVTSLVAEGTPILALNMAKMWKSWGLDVTVATLTNGPMDLMVEYREAGFPVDSLGVNYRAGWPKFWQIVNGVRKTCIRHRPDGVVCFPFGWHSWVAWGARLAGVKRVIAHAGNFPPVSDRDALRKLRMVLKIGEIWRPSIACCSDYVRQGLIDHLGLKASRLRTVYNGVNLVAFAGAPAREQAGEQVLRAGMTARFEPHKDQPTLIRAASLLKQRMHPVELEFAGDGSRRSEFQTLIRKDRMTETVSLLGVRRDMPELLRRWNLFVFSVTPAEGLGIALIEAMAAGVPVIASDVGACREVLESGKWGRLVPQGDAHAMTEAMLDFSLHPEPWWKRADEARAAIRIRFGLEAMAQKYLDMLTAPQ